MPTTATLYPCPALDYPGQGFLSYCTAHPGYEQCWSSFSSNTWGTWQVAINGALTGTGGLENRPLDQLRLVANEWVILPPTEYEQLKQELTAFEATLSQDRVERDLALAKFYGERGLELMRIQLLDDALYEARNQPDVHIAEELAGALERAGFTEAALQTWDAVPTMIGAHDLGAPSLLGNAMLNRGRILESLQRPVEAQIAYATARHMQAIAEQLRL